MIFQYLQLLPKSRGDGCLENKIKGNNECGQIFVLTCGLFLLFGFVFFCIVCFEPIGKSKHFNALPPKIFQYKLSVLVRGAVRVKMACYHIWRGCGKVMPWSLRTLVHCVFASDSLPCPESPSLGGEGTFIICYLVPLCKLCALLSHKL